MATREKQVKWALTQLKAGLLASALPGALLAEYPTLTRSQARSIAGAALRQHKRKKEQQNDDTAT